MSTTDLVLRTGSALTPLRALDPDGEPGLFAEWLAGVDDTFGAGFAALLRGIADQSDQWEWAENEIKKARARHPRHADRIWHSFHLLRPRTELTLLKFEMPFRSHCREILNRVVAGEDTRPGTAAEVWCGMRELSRLSPFTSAAAGLYMRMWRAAGFPEFPEFSEASRHHEALEKPLIDNHEQLARQKLAMDDRRPRDIKCMGLHHAEPVVCVYAPKRQLTIAG